MGFLAVVALSVLAACEPHTVRLSFQPSVGDELRFRSEVTTEVRRTLEGEVQEVTDTAVLDATERVVAVDDAGIRVEVAVSRDGSAARTFDVRLDETSHLTAIDLIEGVPAEALDLELGTDVPSEVAGPPPGRLEPGERWTVERPVHLDGVEEPLLIEGRGRIESLGVEDGTDVAVAVVELEVPVRSVVSTEDGTVTLFGTQTTTSRTAYDLSDGALHRDRTTIVGTVSLLVEPPAGVDVTALQGAIDYEVRTHTRRLG